MAEPRRDRRKQSGPRGARRGLAPTVLVTLFVALLAGVAGHLLPGIIAWAAVGAVALIGGYAAAHSGRGAASGDSRTQQLLSLLDRGGSAESRPPQGFAGDWAALYQRANQMALESQTNSSALAELERFRRQAELAASALHGGKDPLTEIAELRVGPLRALLEAAKNGATVGPVVSRLPLGEEELIGTGGDSLPDGWPKNAAPTATVAPNDQGELSRSLDEVLEGLTELSASLSGRDSTSASSSDAGHAAHRTPAQLVDAVVHTAADGIEDLAAGLMRANELASVAERVTNRATLLALNAALEATRSGSEAFASIAEETRRLAEFAREATDTISRLSSEIEYKVGETITAIHATSEDAKTSLAELSGVTYTAPGGQRKARAQVEALIARARAMRSAWSAPTSAEPEDRPEYVGAARGGYPDPTTPAEDETPQGAGGSSADSQPMQSLVENDRFRADNLSREGILLIEGLQPGARLDS